MKSLIKHKYIIIVSTLVVFLDQFLKYLVSRNMRIGQSITVIQDILNITFVRNSGAAFGFLNRVPEHVTKPVFIVISLAFIVFIVLYYKNINMNNTLINSAFGLIVGGALGNLIDRVRFGMVTDFVEVGLADLKWPVFNLADSAITVGIIILFIQFIRFRKELA